MKKGVLILPCAVFSNPTRASPSSERIVKCSLIIGRSRKEFKKVDAAMSINLYKACLSPSLHVKGDSVQRHPGQLCLQGGRHPVGKWKRAGDAHEVPGGP